MQETLLEDSVPDYDVLSETERRNLRRYSESILDCIFQKRKAKQESRAVVSTISTTPAELADHLGVPRQVVGRTLTALVKAFPGVTKACRSYQFAIDSLPEIRRETTAITDLYTRKAETATVEDIIELFGPVNEREISDELSIWLEYELSVNETRARIAQLESVRSLPGKGGYVSMEEINE